MLTKEWTKRKFQIKYMKAEVKKLRECSTRTRREAKKREKKDEILRTLFDKGVIYEDGGVI